MLVSCKHCQEIFKVADQADANSTLAVALSKISQHMQGRHPDIIKRAQSGELGKLGSEIIQCASALALAQDLTIADQKALTVFIDTLLLQIVNAAAQLARRGVYVKLSEPDGEVSSTESSPKDQNSQGLHIVPRGGSTPEDGGNGAA